MLALCSMLLLTYYAQNYAGIIGASLMTGGSTDLKERNLKELVFSVLHV